MFPVILFAIASVCAQDFEGSPHSNGSSSSSLSVGGPLWVPRVFKIMCCLGGYPVAENPQLVRNWTQEISDYVVDEHYNVQTGSTGERSLEGSCRFFHGSYLLSAEALFHFNDLSGIGVICECPDVPGKDHLDRNCRRLGPCQNNGYHTFSMHRRCMCPEPYFGDYCEKFCDQGQRLKAKDGHDYCACIPFYQGEECKEMVCLNGGTEIKQRCLCLPNYLGYHCEIDTNRTSGTSRFQRYGDQDLIQGSDLFTRDVSGTIFSLIMIIVLVVSMYLLMKHRMQVQNRFTSIRRDNLICGGLTPRRGDVVSPEDARILSFRAAPVLDGGPPPYLPHPQRGRIRRNEHLPPLPSYEDATKLPPLTRPTAIDTSENRETGTQVREPNETRSSEGMAPEDTQPSTSTPESSESRPVFLVERPIIERVSLTRKSI